MDRFLSVQKCLSHCVENVDAKESHPTSHNLKIKDNLKGVEVMKMV